MIKNILIVEDEKDLQQALKRRLEKEGFGVSQAFNGKEGLGFLKSRKIDLILLDIIMPVMDGVQMLKKMQKNGKYDKIKIIILTNLAEHESAREILKSKQADYLIKSNYSLGDIIKKIKLLNNLNK